MLPCTGTVPPSLSLSERMMIMIRRGIALEAVTTRTGPRRIARLIGLCWMMMMMMTWWGTWSYLSARWPPPPITTTTTTTTRPEQQQQQQGLSFLLSSSNHPEWIGPGALMLVAGDGTPRGSNLTAVPPPLAGFYVWNPTLRQYERQPPPPPPSPLNRHASDHPWMTRPPLDSGWTMYDSWGALSEPGTLSDEPSSGAAAGPQVRWIPRRSDRPAPCRDGYLLDLLVPDSERPGGRRRRTLIRRGGPCISPNFTTTQTETRFPPLLLLLLLLPPPWGPYDEIEDYSRQQEQQQQQEEEEEGPSLAPGPDAPWYLLPPYPDPRGWQSLLDSTRASSGIQTEPVPARGTFWWPMMMMMMSSSSSNSWPSMGGGWSRTTFRRNPHRSAAAAAHSHATIRPTDSSWYQVGQRPTTHGLVALLGLVTLALWHYRIPATDVAMVWSRILQPPHFELWRCWSGAWSHVDAWHVLFNGMSLLALGQELEGPLYDSWSFFLWNCSLIPLVAVVWLLLEYYAVRRYYQGSRPRPLETSSSQEAGDSNWLDRPTLGYSGVLFAWIVVASLEQPRTCPIFFLPQICFTTHTLGPVKWSWSPLVQLVLAQVILPRASWTGHLAGIVVGYALHWRWLPSISSFSQPAILYPTLFWLYLQFVRQIVPVVVVTTTSVYEAVSSVTAEGLPPLDRSRSVLGRDIPPRAVGRFCGRCLQSFSPQYTDWRWLALQSLTILLFFATGNADSALLTYLWALVFSRQTALAVTSLDRLSSPSNPAFRHRLQIKLVLAHYSALVMIMALISATIHGAATGWRLTWWTWIEMVEKSTLSDLLKMTQGHLWIRAIHHHFLKEVALFGMEMSTLFWMMLQVLQANSIGPSRSNFVLHDDSASRGDAEASLSNWL